MSTWCTLWSYTIVILLLMGHTSPIEQEDSYLQKGLAQKENGEYAAALETWEEARIVLKKPSLAIAREHIQLATEHNIKDSYQIASAMYFWGLSSAKINPDSIELEMNMLEPVVNESRYKGWKNALKENPSQVLALIHQFWIDQDPSPGSVYNERLLEHWERIAYARKNFTKNDNTVYGTDDRGVGWVKFGKPDLIHNGFLEIETTRVEDFVIQKFSTMLIPIVEIHRAYARNIAAGAWESGGTPREYEIWVYTDHEISKTYNNILIYGNTAVKGFAEAISVDDFIPASASTFSKRFTVQSVGGEFDGNMTPAIALQHEYLRQLAGIDTQFSGAYGNLLFDFFRASDPARKEQTFRYKREQIIKAREIKSMAPAEVSTYLADFPSIPVETFEYKFLDDQNKPYSIVYVESSPVNAFITDLKHNEDSLFADNEFSQSPLQYYSYNHSMHLRDENRKLLNVERLYPSLNIDIYQPVPKTTTIFQVPFVSEKTQQIFSAELKNNHPNSKPSVESTFPKNVRGIGSLKATQPAPLDSSTDKLVMSDVLFGYHLNENSDSVFIPFTVSHTKQVPKGENIALHYELYHLKQNRQNVSEFEIDIEINKNRKGLNRLRRKETNFTLTLTQQSEKALFRENLEIETRDLDIGSYTLRMTITDSNTEQKQEQKIDFEVTEFSEAVFLEDGLNHKKEGNYQTAIDTWLEAPTKLLTASFSIGRAFLELATEQKLKKSYQLASNMYFWGLSAEYANAQAIDTEMDMLEPIVDSNTFETWEAAFNERPENVLPLINQFWLSLDPTPDTPYNERLIEHWERIHYVQEHYKINSTSIYDTDARGPIYVKYGKPDTISKGLFPPYNLESYEVWVYRDRIDDPLYSSHVRIFLTKYLQAYTAREFITPNNSDIVSTAWLSVLAGLDFQFSSAYDRIISRAAGGTRLLIAETVSREIQLEKITPSNGSNAERTFPTIPVNLNSYRFLDENNSPYSLVYMESKPQGAFIMDRINSLRDSVAATEKGNIEEAMFSYRYVHGMQVRNATMDVLASEKVNPEVLIDPGQSSPPSTSIFKIPFIALDATQLFFAELTNNDENNVRVIDSPFPNELRGRNLIKELQPEPLNTDSAALVLSDIIFGSSLVQTNDGSLIPFTVSHTNTIEQGQNLAMHYELYHLAQDETGIANFEIEFQIAKKRKGLNRLRKEEASYTLTLNQQSEHSYFKENLGVETGSLETGTYILYLTITDTFDGRQIERDLEFEIIER